jgi:hypothetical protein
MAPHVESSELLRVPDGALDPLPGARIHDQDPDVIENVAGAAASALGLILRISYGRKLRTKQNESKKEMN